VRPATAIGKVNEKQQDYPGGLLKNHKFSTALDDAVFFTFSTGK